MNCIRSFLRVMTFAVSVFLAVGCRKNTPASFLPINVDDVAYIAIGGDGDVSSVETNCYGEEVYIFPFVEYFRITNSSDVARLTSELNEVSGRKDGQVSFSGVLSSQMYVGHSGQVLAVGDIIMGLSTVLVATNAFTISDGTVFSAYTMGRNESFKASYMHGYAEDILTLMEERSPEEVAKINSWVSVGGMSIRQYMGIEKKETE